MFILYQLMLLARDKLNNASGFILS